MKKLLILIIFFMASFMPVFSSEEGVVLPSVKGLVTNVRYVDVSDDSTIQTKQTVDVKLLSKPYKNQSIVVDNVLTGNPYYDVAIRKGMNIILHVEENDGVVEFSIEDIHRSNVLWLLALIFCGLLVYVGKKKGLCSLISIALTCILIFYGLTPMILLGVNPVFATIVICLLSTAITMYLVGGLNKKSTSAVIGCILSLIFAGALSFITVKIAHLTGFNGENSMFLYSAHPEMNLVSIVVSTMMLATLGAVMDVAMSIASTINEIFTLDTSKTVKELFFSGMNVGRDIIGTMANTLILVYMGASLPLLLLASNIDLQKFFNLNQVVTEIASALIGSSAIVICVPITAIVASELVRHVKSKIDFESLNS